MLRNQYTDWSRVPLVLCIDQAAVLLQMTPENLRKLCRQGKIPAMQLGSEWRISKDSIREQLQNKPA